MIFFSHSSRIHGPTVFVIWLDPGVVSRISVVAVADPDLQIRGEGEQSQKNFFLALWASVWSKNKGGGGVPGSLPWIRH